ncbi:hypothetical protein GE09DRAFT_456973 [Coniochaeta sp. 2T2.1]|nr:hypothetical protein GE09DRAFT_456973 [Coniochaeta sp. 2T2.1]
MEPFIQPSLREEREPTVGRCATANTPVLSASPVSVTPDACTIKRCGVGLANRQAQLLLAAICVWICAMTIWWCPHNQIFLVEVQCPTITVQPVNLLLTEGVSAGKAISSFYLELGAGQHGRSLLLPVRGKLAGALNCTAHGFPSLQPLFLTNSKPGHPIEWSLGFYMPLHSTLCQERDSRTSQRLPLVTLSTVFLDVPRQPIPTRMILVH